MYKGEFVGKNTKNQKMRILILGESHYWSESDSQEETKKRLDAYNQNGTTSVVERYLKNYNSDDKKDRAYQFFDNIVRTFGIDPNEHENGVWSRDEFWNSVYFGNYIDEFAGKRDRTASKLLKNVDNCERYNDQLFKFIRENDIDVVFCFSRKVFYHLPVLENKDEEKMFGEKSDHERVYRLVYRSGERTNVVETLNKSVTFYCQRHTQNGYSWKKGYEILSEIQKDDSVLNAVLGAMRQLNLSENVRL